MSFYFSFIVQDSSYLSNPSRSISHSSSKILDGASNNGVISSSWISFPFETAKIPGLVCGTIVSTEIPLIWESVNYRVDTERSNDVLILVYDPNWIRHALCRTSWNGCYGIRVIILTGGIWINRHGIGVGRSSRLVRLVVNALPKDQANENVLHLFLPHQITPQSTHGPSRTILRSIHFQNKN